MRLACCRLGALADELAAGGRGLIMVMGKGGVGKTTIAAALALALVQRGHSVHLSTTDPAAHLAVTLGEDVPGLRVDRIDPKAETQRYIDKIMAARSPRLNEQERALLLEDLRSPCTEEVAVFHAFSRIVSEARSAFVVLDTAPTGHSLLLMDATGAYHRQTMREYGGHIEGRTTAPSGDTADAPAGCRLHADHRGDAARGHAGFAGGGAAGRSASREDRALGMGDQQKRFGCRNAGSAVDCASCQRTQANGAHARGPGEATVHDSVVGARARRRCRTFQVGEEQLARRAPAWQRVSGA
jgi:hypothetical protein